MKIKKGILNVPTGTIRGSEEERLQKAEKKKSREDRIAEYLKFLERTRSRKGKQFED